MAEVNSSPWSDQFDVGDASINAFKLLYGAQENNTSAKLRSLHFCKLVICSADLNSL